MPFFLMSIAVAWLVLKSLDTFIAIFLKRKARQTQYQIDVEKEAQKRLDVLLKEMAEERINPDREYYEFYESPVAEVPVYGCGDKEVGLRHAEEIGLDEPVVVKTTIGGYAEHIKELSLKAATHGMYQKKRECNHPGWDEELFGEHPDDSL